MKTRKWFLIAAASLVVVFVGFLVVNELNSTQEDLYQNIKKKKLPKEARILKLQEYFDGLRIPFGGSKSGYPANYLLNEYEKLKNNSISFKAAYPEIDWVMRGPSNVGGRTRGIIVDPDDATHNTWFVGTATGGVWKTSDGGVNWVCLTNDIPYQATTTLAMALSNTSILYMGTGESFPGSIYTTGGGIFKSINKGSTWVHLTSTANNEDFRYVNRIVIDPSNENIVLAATYTGILKSIDGGVSWEKVYSGGNVEDIVADTSDFINMYAGVNSIGVIRSIDEGDTWLKANVGIGGGRERIELDVSPVNTNYVFASIHNSDESATLYFSSNKGLEWQKIEDIDENNFDFLGKQGMYDNTIAAHPFYDSIVYWGGVNLWKAYLTSEVINGNSEVTDFYNEGAESFLSYTSFTGNLFPGMNIGSNEGAIEVSESDYAAIEIRFGPGVTQKAHRFFVPEGATSGVPASDYTYQDYVDVPFQVWDITNNRQLMCSFRDQERDGEFNLYESTGSAYGELGREYLFVNAVEYNAATPNSDITTQGRSYKLIYFFWPVLAENGVWTPDNLPVSKAVVQYGLIKNRMSTIENISDSYGAYGGKNSYDQSAGMGTQAIPGLHPDHHELIMVPVNNSTKDFWIVNSNDGGLSISKDKGNSFTQIKNHLITTQFYGVAKKPYRNEYIGGMQDNGTWQSPTNTDANLSEGYFFRLGGDGFETVWHLKDSNKIMGCLYNNAIYRSLDNGINWESASEGILEDDGPFVTHLTQCPSNPSKIFAVGAHGLYYTVNFGNTSWWKTNLGAGWLGNDNALSSSHNVEVSLANDSVVWAGAALYADEGYSIFVSTNQGKNFTTVNESQFDMPYKISGIATHPVNRNEAFLLYGAAQKPKILRTYDRGQTWEDMSGFGFDTVSTGGFPDVGVYSLFVFPDDTNRIWVGTEIGIIESGDNGVSWHYLNSELPSVTIWQIFMQNNQIVVSTYGRGIWTYQYAEPDVPPVGIKDLIKNDLLDAQIYPNPAKHDVIIEIGEGFDNQKTDISIFTSEGKQVFYDNFLTDNRKIDINIEDFKEGNYFVKIRFGNKKTITKKLIIAR